MKYRTIFLSLILIFSCNFRTRNLSIAEKAKSNSNFCDTTNFNVYNYFPKNKITRFQKEIDRFAKLDSISFPEKNSVLIVGSSSIRKWHTLEEDLQPFKAINRGFGGSTFPELIYYSDNLIFKYNPQIIVIYEGDNDQYFITPQQILENACYLEKLIHAKLPESTIFFVSTKPSPSRKDKIKGMITTNNYLNNYSEKTKKTHFINIWDSMFEKNGQIKSDIFKSDSLHLNAKGYEIWTGIIKSEIEKQMKMN